MAVSPAAAMSAISAAQLHLDELLAGASGVTIASLSEWGWRPGQAFPSGSIPTGNTIVTSTTPDYTFSSGPWTVDGTTYSAVESDWSTDVLQTTVSCGTWNYDETGTSYYQIDVSGGFGPTTASGSLTFTLEALGASWGSQYDFRVTATATAGGNLPSPSGGGAGGGGNGGTWTQTTTNRDYLTARG